MDRLCVHVLLMATRKVVVCYTGIYHTTRRVWGRFTGAFVVHMTGLGTTSARKAY